MLKFIIYLHTKFNLPDSSILPVIVINRNVKYTIRAATMLAFYTVQKHAYKRHHNSKTLVTIQNMKVPHKVVVILPASKIHTAATVLLLLTETNYDVHKPLIACCSH